MSRTAKIKVNCSDQRVIKLWELTGKYALESTEHAHSGLLLFQNWNWCIWMVQNTKNFSFIVKIVAPATRWRLKTILIFSVYIANEVYAVSDMLFAEVGLPECIPLSQNTLNLNLLNSGSNMLLPIYNSHAELVPPVNTTFISGNKSELKIELTCYFSERQTILWSVINRASTRNG